jgi:peptidoglycan-associated lipoprotein
MRVAQLVLIVMTGLAVVGCKSKPPVIPETPPPQDTSATSTSGTGSSAVTSQPTDAGTRALQEAQRAGTIIYFDYDKAEIKSEFVPIVTAHAKYLILSTNNKIRLEGHTDERGSREYNIGLGERRAQAVRRALMLQGVTEAQITTVSYGEERPAVQGSDDAAYAKNRRVELVYAR